MPGIRNWLHLVPQHLIDAVTGDTARRIGEIERRLERLDGPRGQEGQGKVGELVILVSKLGPSKSESTDQTISTGFTSFNVLVGIFFLALLIALPIFANVDKRKVLENVSEYLSYALPLVAGFMAEAGLYGTNKNKSEIHNDQRKSRKSLNVLCFEGSVVFLLMGLFGFIISKKQGVNVAFDLIGFLGLIASIALVARNGDALKNNPKRGDIWARPFVYLLFGVSIAMAATWIYVIWTSSPDWAPATLPLRIQKILHIAPRTNTEPTSIEIMAKCPWGEFQSLQADRNLNNTYPLLQSFWIIKSDKFSVPNFNCVVVYYFRNE
jgi:hypothetical protein